MAASSLSSSSGFGCFTAMPLIELRVSMMPLGPIRWTGRGTLLTSVSSLPRTAVLDLCLQSTVMPSRRCKTSAETSQPWLQHHSGCERRPGGDIEACGAGGERSAGGDEGGLGTRLAVRGSVSASMPPAATSVCMSLHVMNSVKS